MGNQQIHILLIITLLLRSLVLPVTSVTSVTFVTPFIPVIQVAYETQQACPTAPPSCGA
ncbi:16721_t:CDS:1, partial [Cetraspora pellucida]